MNTNNLINKVILCSLAMAGAALLPSCVSPKEVLYIQDVSGNSRETIKANYQTTIQKDDQLYIAVSSGAGRAAPCPRKLFLLCFP